MKVILRLGDCVERLRSVDEGSFSAVVCDPPYGLEFMGREWDRLGPDPSLGGNPRLREHRRVMTDAPATERGNPWASERRSYGAPKKNPRCRVCGKLRFTRETSRCQCDSPDWDTREYEYSRAMQTWHRGWLEEVYRVLTPGGVVKAFSGTRTNHRLAAAMEAAGFVDVKFEAWGYGSGFPKSLNVGKALDRRSGDGAREEFYAHLRERREAAGLSVTQVSELVVGQKTGSCWNWEHYSLPEPRFWPTLRDLLGLDPKWEPLILGAVREVLAERTMVQGGGTALEMRVGERREVPADITSPATDAAKFWDGWGTALKPAWEPVLVGRKP